MNFSAAAFCSGSSAEMVITSTPWDRSLASSFPSSGSSSRQGAHQVAQKSYTATLPLCELTSFWKPASSTDANGPVANSGRQRANAIANFLILGHLVNALDGAAERLGLHRLHGFARQQCVQGLAQALHVNARHIHVVIDGA